MKLKKLIKHRWAFILGTIFVSLFLSISIALIAMINKDDKIFVKDSSDSNSTIKISTRNEPTWIFEASRYAMAPYSYPLTELHIKLGDGGEIVNNIDKYYKISIDRLSDYDFFCINQILRKSQISYSYYKVDGLIKLIITHKNKDVLQMALRELDSYKIEYEISEVG